MPTKQPGNEIKRRYYERGPEVDVMQHDGTAECAQEIVDWLHDPRIEANIVPEGSFNNDMDNTYVAIGSAWGVKYVGPGDWVVRDINRSVEVHNNTAFKLRYLALTGVV